MKYRWNLALGLLTVCGWPVQSLFGGQTSGDNSTSPGVDHGGVAPTPVLASLPVASTPGATLPTITPNGIITLFGKPQVLFKVSALPGGSTDHGQSYLLGEGDRQAGIEIKQIDLQSSLIIFNNHGLLQKLPLVAGTAWNNDPADTSKLAEPDPAPEEVIARSRLGRRQALANPAGAVPVPVLVAVNSASVGGGGEANPPPSRASSVDRPPVDTEPKGASSQVNPPASVASLTASGDSSDSLTPAELAAQDNAAGGDVPPPPPRN